MKTTRTENIALVTLVILALSVGGWSIACLVSAWSAFGMTALITGWLTSIGTPATMVAYYTQIKGVEYIICAAFLALFPVYWKVVNKTPVKIKA